MLGNQTTNICATNALLYQLGHQTAPTKEHPVCIHLGDKKPPVTLVGTWTLKILDWIQFSISFEFGWGQRGAFGTDALSLSLHLWKQLFRHWTPPARLKGFPGGGPLPSHSQLREQ